MQLELLLLKGAKGENCEKEFELVTIFYDTDINAKYLSSISNTEMQFLQRHYSFHLDNS